MKIICIGRNYINHAKELNNPVPVKPIFFLKPDSSILQKNRPFYIPPFSNEIHYELELVVRINRVGKNIAEKFAHRYYDEIALGIDFTARDLQDECKKKGLPWEIAKTFDNSAVLSEFVKLDAIGDIGNLNFQLRKNDQTVQDGNTSNMIFKVDFLIAYLSQFYTLKMGDIIYTGTPEGVGPVAIGDNLAGSLEGEELLNFQIK
jgi:acylpyruvate hydrolase